MTDPIADLLTRIKNAYLARHATVNVPYSKVKETVCQLLKEAGYIGDSVTQDEGAMKAIHITLKYFPSGDPAINHISRVSKPGRRLYTTAKNLPRPLSGRGIAIISTSHGIMLNTKARKERLGGEIICEVW